jgi:hypothetical protein
MMRAPPPRGRTVVLALDPEAPADGAALLRWAAHALVLAPPGDRVHLVAACAPQPPEVGFVSWSLAASDAAAEAAATDAAAVLAGAPAAANLASWADAGAVTKTVLAPDDARPWRGCAAALADYAEAVHADVLVCGSRGLGAVTRRARARRCVVRDSLFLRLR